MCTFLSSRRQRRFEQTIFLRRFLLLLCLFDDDKVHFYLQLKKKTKMRLVVSERQHHLLSHAHDNEWYSFFQDVLLLTKDEMDEEVTRDEIFPSEWTPQQKADRIIELAEHIGRMTGHTRADVALSTACYSTMSTTNLEMLLNDETFMWTMKTLYLLKRYTGTYGDNVPYIDERDGNESSLPYLVEPDGNGSNI